MRADMAKVIVERPRFGSRMPSRRKGYRKYIQKSGIENLPTREPMLGHWRGRDRWLNEHLGPMKRFLRSRVGRPWNKVHQELCEHVSFDNAVQKHVLAHVFEFVQRFVEIRGDQIIVRNGWGRGRTLQPGKMYVCPNSGLLKLVRQKSHAKPVRRVQRDWQLQYHWRDNHWWEVRLRPRPDDPGELWDVWFERPLARVQTKALDDLFGRKLMVVSKRMLSPTEVRQLHRSLRKDRS